MISSRNDYLQYLEADRVALKKSLPIRFRPHSDPIWAFQQALRRYEYALNCNKNKIYRSVSYVIYRMLGLLLNFSIPPNAFGPGLSIAHYGTIVVNSNARIGANCRIHVCVNIGADARDGTKAPHIGDNCYIGPGAKIFGAIKIGNHVAIGANAVVNKSFVENNVSLGGIPAKVISETGTGEIESMQAVSEASSAG
jgi:serine O-acetyltransferase